MKIPKVAGTSILRGILEKEINDIIHKGSDESKFNHWYTNATKKQLQQYFSFTFVRNPWDRIVSLYHYFNLKSSEDISFREFVIKRRFKCSKYYKTIPGHSLPQYHYLRLTDIDFVGRYENLENDWKYVAQKIGVCKNLPHNKKSERNHYREYYDKDTIEIIRTEYKKDIELLKYNY